MLLIDLPIGFVVVGVLLAVALVLGLGFLAAWVSIRRDAIARWHKDAGRYGRYYRSYRAMR